VDGQSEGVSEDCADSQAFGGSHHFPVMGSVNTYLYFTYENSVLSILRTCCTTLIVWFCYGDPSVSADRIATDLSFGRLVLSRDNFDRPPVTLKGNSVKVLSFHFQNIFHFCGFSSIGKPKNSGKR
jgi:hypothetical protein